MSQRVLLTAGVSGIDGAARWCGSRMKFLGCEGMLACRALSKWPTYIKV
jgi:hypothetical protein